MIGIKHIRRVRRARGFALLVAIVLSAVAAVVTFALASLAYKSLLLASDALQSQYAFYAADSALECALLGDRGNVTFPYTQTQGTVSTLTCAGSSISFKSSNFNGDDTVTVWSASSNQGWFTTNTDPNNISRCARITVYKTNQNVTSIFAEGLNVDCSNRADPRALERSIKAFYGGGS